MINTKLLLLLLSACCFSLHAMELYIEFDDLTNQNNTDLSKSNPENPTQKTPVIPKSRSNPLIGVQKRNKIISNTLNSISETPRDTNILVTPDNAEHNTPNDTIQSSNYSSRSSGSSVLKVTRSPSGSGSLSPSKSWRSKSSEQLHKSAESLKHSLNNLKKSTPQEEQQLRIDPLNEQLIFAVKKQDLPCIQGYVTLSHININQQDSDGNTVLHHAVQVGNPEIFKFILKNPSVRTMYNFKMQTPAHFVNADAENKLYLKGILFARASFDANLEKHIVASLMEQKPENIRYTHIQNASKMVTDATINRLLPNINLLVDTIMQAYEKDYDTQQNTADRTIPAFVRETQDYITSDFTKTAILAWLHDHKQQS